MSPDTMPYEAAATEALPAAAATTVPADGLEPRQSVAFAIKLAYGIGALSDAVKTFGFTTFLLFYYTTVLGLPGTLLGLAMAIGLVWDATIDPFIGHLSDRSQSRFGRRHVFMLFGGLLAGVSFIAVFNPPHGLSTAGLFAWLMVTSLGLRSSNSLFMVPYYALGSEMTPDEHEQMSISGYRGATVLAGMLLTTTFSFSVYLPGTETGADARFASASYASLGFALGVVMIVAALVATAGTLRTRSHLVEASAEKGQARFGPMLGEVLGVPRFRLLIAISCLSFIAMAINAALSLHYLTYYAGVSGRGVTAYMLSMYAGGLLGVPLWVRVTKRIAKHHVYGATMLAAAAVMSAGYWLVGEGRPFGTGAVWVLAAGSAIAGWFNAAGLVIAPALVADLSGTDSERAGRRRDGSLFGLYSLAQQLAAGVAVLTAGVLVERFAGLIPAQAVQTSTTIERIAILSNVLPAAIMVVAAGLTSRYSSADTSRGGAGA